VLGAAAFAVDRTTGDETGQPYDEPLINKLAFYLFPGRRWCSSPLCFIAVVRQIRVKLQLRRRSG